MNRPAQTALALVLLLTCSRASAAPGDLASDFIYFGTAGKIQNAGVGFANAIAVDLQGRLVIAASGAGSFRVQRRGGRRFAEAENIDIVIDPGQTAAEADAVAIAPDGKIVVAGTVVFGDTNDFAVARLNPDFTWTRRSTSMAPHGSTSTGVGATGATGWLCNPTGRSSSSGWAPTTTAPDGA